MFRFVSVAISAYAANSALRNFNVVFAAASCLYRLALTVGVATAEAPPLGTQRTLENFVAIFATLGDDLVLLFFLNGVVFFGYLVLAAIRKNPGNTGLKSGRFLTLLFFPGMIFWFTTVMGSHFNLLFTMNSGFTWAIFMEFFTILSFSDFVALLKLRDYITLALPLLGYLFLMQVHIPLITRRRLAGMSAVTLVLLMSGMLAGAKPLPDELSLNPQTYFFRDALRSLASPRSEKTSAVQKGNQVFLGDPLFANVAPAGGRGPGRGKVAANIVVIVLESTATEYIFDTGKYAGGKMPMPFLHSLTGKSLHFTKHFASNNSSPRSMFAIFSGLYESPETRFFSMERNLKIPHLLDFLGGGYESFLVTPADLNWYFPKSWFQNRGFTRLNDYNALKSIPEYKAGPTPARDEFKTVDFFLELTGKSDRPFLGVYYTFVGHWPYPDLAAEHKIIPANSSRSRYINNLYAQDQVIQKVIEGLAANGKLENTIVVMVGDHGEAFYQHPGNRVHSAESYNENLMAPLIVYAPGLIKPQRIAHPTVHADIVPTLLDALGIAFDAKQFQGESALRAAPRRHYIFSYGNENTLTAVSGKMQKMQIMRTAKTCRNFNLEIDAAELNNLACETGSAQYRALETFYRNQPGILKGYNELCNRVGC